MKLFYYDEKHQNIVAELDLGRITTKEEELIENIIAFLQKTHIINGRYQDLVIANSYELEEGDYGYPTIVFNYEGESQ